MHKHRLSASRALHEKTEAKFDHDQTFAALEVWMPDRRSGKKQSSRRPLFHPDAKREAATDMSPSARTIIELNIRHYRELLKTETDPSKRRTIEQLLAEEEAKLAKLSSKEEK